MADWLVHSISNAIIHALIYGLIFRLMHHLTLGQAAVLVVVVLVVMFLWARARDRRGWSAPAILAGQSPHLLPALAAFWADCLLKEEQARPVPPQARGTCQPAFGSMI